MAAASRLTRASPSEQMLVGVAPRQDGRSLEPTGVFEDFRVVA
jgi:hypothetical protein